MKCANHIHGSNTDKFVMSKGGKSVVAFVRNNNIEATASDINKLIEEHGEEVVSSGKNKCKECRENKIIQLNN